jgi:ribonucleotide monophosphatase NagD (HAD superfamily)
MTRLDNYEKYLTLSLEELDNAIRGTDFEIIQDDEEEMVFLYDKLRFHIENMTSPLKYDLVDSARLCITNRDDIVLEKDILNHASADYSLACVQGSYEFIVESGW